MLIIIIIKAASSVERVFDTPQAVVRTSRCIGVSRTRPLANVGSFRAMADGTMYLGVTAVS